MQEFIRPSILFACSLCFLTACSDETTQSNKKQEQTTPATPATPDQAKVQKAISLKDLVIGKDVKKLKNAKNFSANAYMFNYDYFGEKRSFVANTNDKGEIYKYKTTFNGSLDELKTALEEKLTSENGTTVKFKCTTKSIKPDSSAEISTRTCEIKGQSDSLMIEESKIQPTEKYAGLPRVPTVITSLTLEGTVLSAESRAAEEKKKADKQRANEALRKKDI